MGTGALFDSYGNIFKTASFLERESTKSAKNDIKTMCKLILLKAKKIKSLVSDSLLHSVKCCSIG